MKKVLLPILFAVIALYVYRSDFFGTPAQKDSQQIHTVIETYIKGIKIKQFNAEGEIKNQIISNYAEQQNNSPMITLDHPEILALTAQHNWQLTASKGLYDSEKGTLRASGSVIIKRMDGFVTMKTQSLDYNFNTDLIYTDSPVHIASKTGDIQATGMTVDLNKETLELHQKIETRYEPNSP